MSRTKTKNDPNKWPQIRKYKTKSGEWRWQVDTRIKEAGRVVGKRSSYETRQEAKSVANLERIKRRNEGSTLFDFAERHRNDAKQAVTFFSDWLVDREGVWAREFGRARASEMIQAARGRFSLKTAAERFLVHLGASLEIPSKSATNVAEELVELKESAGRSHRYVLDLKNRLARFNEDFGNRMVGEIKSAELDSWLLRLKVRATAGSGQPRTKTASATTKNNFRRILRVFFGFAQSRGYCLGNPMEGTEEAKGLESEVGILTPAQLDRLLNAANAEEGMVPILAIGAFAGLRRAELERLDWSEIDLEDGLIEVKARKAKSARRRFVKISDNLGLWLRPHWKESGEVVPEAFQRRFIEVRKLAKISDWPNNALRHSFASYHLSKNGDAAALALELGHTNSVLVFDHYRQLVKPKEAERYWKIAPGGV